MHVRCHRFVSALTALFLVITAQSCSNDGEISGTPYSLPEELIDLSPQAKETLRVVFTIDGVVGPVNMIVDAQSATASGKFSLPNEPIENASVHMELFGALNSATPEVLLGAVSGTINIEPGQYNSANLPAMTTTGELFDANRNGDSNLVDMLANIDPGPMDNPLDISPDTISFDSGVEVGGFTRSFFVVENNGEESVSMDMAVQLAPGITIAPLESIFELGSASPDDNFYLELAPGEEQVMAVTFAPSDSLFLAGALSLNSKTQTSGISHGLMMRLIGNPEGAVPQPPSAYDIPDPSSVKPDGYTGNFQAYGLNKLFSREPFNPQVTANPESGTIAGQDIDDAYLVVVPKGYRFSLTLDGLTEDLDLFLFDADVELNTNGTLSNIAISDYTESAGNLACPDSLSLNAIDCSTNVGQSSESISYDGTQQSQALRYIIVGIDVREELSLDDSQNTDEETDASQTTQSLTGHDPQSPGIGMQAAMYNQPDIEFIESTRPCPNTKYGLAACSSAAGGATLTVYGVNFEPGMTATITWRDIATGNEVAAPAVCSAAPVDDAVVERPTRDAQGNVISIEQLLLDKLVCITPEAIVNPQVGPKANLILTNPNGAVAVRPEAIVYLPPAPEVDRVFPAAGPTTGATTITVFGDNFYELNGRQPVVAFGQYPTDTIGTEDQPTTSDESSSYVIASVRSVSDDGREIIVELPVCDGCEETTPHAITVINPDLQYRQEGSLFTYVRPSGPGPELLGVYPAQGSVTGSPVHLYGTNFFDIDSNPVATVLVDNREVTLFTTYAAGAPECPADIGAEYDCIALDVPAHDPGAVPVEVTNSEDQTSRLPNGYSYQYPNPVLNGVFPSTGSTAGGLPVTVSGECFQPGARVYFDETESAIVTYNSANSLTAVTPAGLEPGMVSIRVTHIDETSSTSPDLFTFVAPAPAPEITNITPPSGYTTGGQDITINGSHFQNGIKVFFGNTSAPTVTFINDSQIQVVTPARQGPEVVSITLENTDLNSVTLPAAFTYSVAPPSISAVDPGFAPIETTTTIFITGNGFQAGATVLFGDTPANSTTVNSSTLILASTPSVAQPVSVSVQVTNPDNQVAVYEGFSFEAGLQAPPRIIGVSPDWGPPAGGMQVTITGQGLTGETTVSFDDVPVAVEAITVDASTGDPQIIVYAPSHAAGDAILRVENSDGQADAFTFTYQDPVGLAVTSVVPNRGDYDLLNNVLIVGHGFTEGAIVEMSGIIQKMPNSDCLEQDEEDFEFSPTLTHTLIPTWISSSVLSAVIPASTIDLSSDCVNVYDLPMRITVSQNGESPALLENAFIYEAPDSSSGPSITVLPQGSNTPCSALGLGGISVVVEGESPVYVCNGSDGTNGDHGIDGREITVTPTLIGPGEAPCGATGGTLLTFNTLENGAIVSTTQYSICNGSDGTNGDSGTDGSDGTNGDSGTDGADGTNGNDGTNGADGTNGTSTIIITDDSDECDGKGTAYTVGIDTNGDGNLTGDELTNAVSTDICDGDNGLDGATGPDGTDGTNGSDGEDGANGSDGEDGSDGADGANGSDGADGADGIRTMASMTNLLEGDPNCPWGGTKITIWVDTDLDGLAGPQENPVESYSCNGYGWNFDPNQAPTVSHTFPTSLHADLGGLVGITGTNFSVTQTKVVISGQELTPIAAQSSTTYLMVQLPAVPQQSVPEERDTGDIWGDINVGFQVVNANGQSAMGSIYYQRATCWNRGDAYCPEGYACDAEPIDEQLSCVWGCDTDSQLEYPEQCDTRDFGWRTVCGGSTFCTMKPGRAGSPITFFSESSQTTISFGGIDANGTPQDDLWVGFQQPGSSPEAWQPELIWLQGCTSDSCTNSPRPSARSHHVWFTSKVDNKAYLFGGELADGSYSDELWQLSFTGPHWTWTLVCGGATGCSGPSGRARTASFNSGQHIAVFGGQNTNGALSDTWFFDIANGVWEQYSCQGGACDDQPSARYSAYATLTSDDAEIFHVFMAGGQTDGSLSDELWYAQLAAGATSLQWTLVCGGTSPCAGLPAIKEGAFYLSTPLVSTGKRSLLYHGGEDAGGAITDTTYEIMLGTGDDFGLSSNWTAICGTGTGCSGQAISESTGGYHPAGHLYLFGGKGNNGIRDELLSLDFSTSISGGQTCGQFGFAAGTMGCSNCSLDTSSCIAMSPTTCGNGVVETDRGEECEPSLFSAGAPCNNSNTTGALSIENLGGGLVTCGNNCRFDYSGCTLPYQCGSTSLDHPLKNCDATSLRFPTCAKFWQHIGDGQRVSPNEETQTLSCTSSCQADISSCDIEPCGNGDIDIQSKESIIYYTEACDPGNGPIDPNYGGLSCTEFGKVGQIACGAAASKTPCEFDLSGCSDPAPSCSNGGKDGNETGVDCGGDVCLPCVTGQECANSGDCLSNICSAAIGGNGQCQATTFSDSILGGRETDVDCGGPGSSASQKCLVTKGCVVDSDCSECLDVGCTATYTAFESFSKAVLCKEQKCVLANGVSGCSSQLSGLDCFSGQCSITGNTNTCTVPNGQGGGD